MDLTGRGCPEQVRVFLGVSKGRKGVTLAPSLLSRWEARGDDARRAWLCLLDQGPPAPRKPRIRGCSETSGGVFSEAAQAPGQSPGNAVSATGPGSWGSWRQDVTERCHRGRGHLEPWGLLASASSARRATWAGQFLLRSAFKNNANVAATRSSSHLGPPRSQLLCSPASEPPYPSHLHSIPATGSGEALEMPEGLRSAVPSGT